MQRNQVFLHIRHEELNKIYSWLACSQLKLPKITFYQWMDAQAMLDILECGFRHEVGRNRLVQMPRILLRDGTELYHPKGAFLRVARAWSLRIKKIPPVKEGF